MRRQIATGPASWPASKCGAIYRSGRNGRPNRRRATVRSRRRKRSAQLASLLPRGAEQRPEQASYAAATVGAFAPRQTEDRPNVVLAEAGTGVGKTVGYVAPASLWAEKNGGTVWLSTFTRNLQNQLDRESDRLYADPAEKARKIVLRKGRENYLCLLNLDDAVAVARTRREEAVNLGLVARWILATRDGALVAGDMPGWLADRIGRGRIDALTDHRGECVYAACRHYSRCFVEHNVRRARRARIVIANHALVMAQTAMAAIHPGDPHAPARLVFDEGHHLFGAADSAFAAHLSGQETSDLRRWLRGPEAAAGRTVRVRGLKSRIADLIVDDGGALEALEQILRHAAQLPAPGWLQRLAAGNPQGVAERFLAIVREQVYARTPQRDSPYGLEIRYPARPRCLARNGRRTGCGSAQSRHSAETPPPGAGRHSRYGRRNAGHGDPAAARRRRAQHPAPRPRCRSPPGAPCWKR